MSLQFCLPLVSFIYEAPSCASLALLELQTCTKVFRAGTVSVCGTGCTCIFLKSSLKHTYSDTHTGSTFSGLSNSLLFYNTKLEERWRNENIFFFIESCKLQSIYSREKSCSQELFQLLLEPSLSFYLCGNILIFVPFFFTFKYNVSGSVDSLNSLLTFSLIEWVAGRQNKI